MDDRAVSDTMRRWYALESLWKLGATQEAQRLAASFVGCRACLKPAEDSAATDDGAPVNAVTLSNSFIDRDPLAPGGITIKFECRLDDGRGFLADFWELLYIPEEDAPQSAAG